MPSVPALSHGLATHGYPSQGPIPPPRKPPHMSPSHQSSQAAAGLTAALRACRVCQDLPQTPAIPWNPVQHLPNGLLGPVELLQDTLDLLVDLAVLPVHGERAPATRGEAVLIKCLHNLSGPLHTRGAAQCVATGQLGSLLSH